MTSPKVNPTPANSGMHKRCVCAYFDDHEHAKLKATALAIGDSMSAVLRQSFLSGPPITVPQVNRDKWVELARVLDNLNQLTHRVNIGQLPEDLRPTLGDLKVQIHELRSDLTSQKGGSK